MKAAPHPSQTARLSALRSYDILDTPREADFDEIVALASAICETPISVVNLIDSDRQWFKAEVGLGVRETPLDTSICAHAILEQDVVEIADTRLDSRMKDNDLVVGDPGLRFYAGALLETEDGLPLGTLCVLDYRPRTLTQIQRQTLRILSKQVMTQLDLRLGLKRQKLLTNEIDHRVKNSLQSVAALVRLQRNRSNNTDVRSALDDVSTRLQTISLVHDELHMDSASGEVDLGRYVVRLGMLLGSNAPDNVELTTDAQSIFVDSKLASSLGMVVSEFSANSLKHAFPNGRKGTIRISLRSLGGGKAELSCEDDGVGISEPAGAAARGGLGLRIIDASAAQIGGKVERTSGVHGVRLQLTFPILRE